MSDVSDVRDNRDKEPAPKASYGGKHRRLKHFFRLIVGRFFWVAVALLIEFALIFALIYFAAVSWGPESLVYVSLGVSIIAFITMIYIVNTRANPAYKISWLFLVGIIPFLGIVCYLFLGNKNTTERMKKTTRPIKEAARHIKTDPSVQGALRSLEGGERAGKLSFYLQKESGPGLYNETVATYFPSGEAVFPIMLEELKKAEHYIFVEYFIVAPGIMWNSILKILAEKAAAGVDVRFMYDDVGSITTLPMSYPRKMEALGIKCVAFNRFKPLIDVKLNNRDHRKILVIDGHVGFTGGINLADEYINAYPKYGHWKDNALMLSGKGVHGLTMLFLTHWAAVNGGLEELSDAIYDPYRFVPEGTVFPSDGFVQPYGDIPYDDEPVGERVYLSLIHGARRYLYVTTPYLIIDDDLESSFIAAAKEGVDVRIVTPRIPDKKTVFSVTRSYYRRLIEGGVRIYEYKPGFVHAKMFVSDDLFGTVGSINLDYRSLYLHLENGVYLFRNSCIAEMKKDFLQILAASEEITPERYKKIARGKRLWWSLLRVIAPLM